MAYLFIFSEEKAKEHVLAVSDIARAFHVKLVIAIDAGEDYPEFVSELDPGFSTDYFCATTYFYVTTEIIDS